MATLPGEGGVGLTVARALSLKHRVEKCAWSADRKRLAVCLGDFSVRVYDCACDGGGSPTLQHACSLRGHTASVWSAGFSQDSLLLCSGSSDKTVRVWSLSRRENVSTFTLHSDTIWCCSFMPGSTELVASGSSDKTVMIWNHATGEVLHSLDTYSEAVESLSFSRDGTRLCTGSRDGRLVLWTGVSPKASLAPVQVELYQGEEWIRFVEFSQHLNDLLLTNGDSNSVLVWDLSNLATPHTSSTKPGSKTVRFADSVVSSEKLHSLQPVMELKGHLNTVWDACFATNSSGKKLVITCSGDRTLR